MGRYNKGVGCLSHTYGFDPAEYSTDISVERIPEP
jgi:hypothetical protein